jgi:hypothetical protein
MTQEGWIHFRNFLRTLVNDQKNILKFLYGVLGYGESLLIDSFQDKDILNKFQQRHLQDLKDIIKEIGNDSEEIEPIHQRIVLIEEPKTPKEKIEKNLREREKSETPKYLKSWEKIPMSNHELLNDPILKGSSNQQDILQTTRNNTTWEGYLRKDLSLMNENSIVPYLKTNEPYDPNELKRIFENSASNKGMNFNLEIGRDLDYEVNPDLKKLYQYLLMQTQLATKYELANDNKLIHNMFESADAEINIPSMNEKRDMYNEISKTNSTDAKINTRLVYKSAGKHPLVETPKKWDHNTFQLKKDYSKEELMEIALGMNPNEMEEEFRKESNIESLNFLKSLNVPLVDDSILEFTEDKKISESRNSVLEQISKLKEERIQNRVAPITKNIIKRLEIDQTIKETRGEIDNERKLEIEKLKSGLKDKEEDKYELSVRDEARLNELKFSTIKKNDDLQQLDQLLDQMNRELKRELFSSKKNSIPNEMKELINNYSQLRSYYSQLERSDISLRNWNTLTPKEKEKVEMEYQKNFQTSYKNIISSIKNKMER